MGNTGITSIFTCFLGHLLTSKHSLTHSGEKPMPDAKATPSGPDGKNPSTAGPGSTKVHTNTPENQKSKLNPSAPNDVNITPNSDYKQ